MSQVIVTNDKLTDKRQKSRDQERKIKVEDMFARWRRDDVTKPDPFKKMVGLAVTPVLAIWAALCALMAGVMFVTRSIFKGLGRVIGGSRSLITGATRGSSTPEGR